MPRAQVNLLGVALVLIHSHFWVDVVFSSVLNAEEFLQMTTDVLYPSAKHQDRHRDETISYLVDILEDDISSFQTSFLRKMAGSHILHKREMRQKALVTDGRVLDDAFSKIIQQKTSAMSCFLWEDEKYCIYGDSVIGFSGGKALHLLSNLPVQEEDQVRTYVYDGFIFIAFFNRIRSTLRLHILRSPSSTTLAEVQQIFGEKLEDCQFFEHGGRLHMALAIQLGPTQFAKDLGMRCVIYEWLGTTMDMIHSFPASGLHRIAVFRDTIYTHLVLVQRNSYVQLWRLILQVQKAELLEKIDVGLADIFQVKAFASHGHWCTLFATNSRSVIYCLMGQRLLRWQVIEHVMDTSAVMWTELSISSSSTILALIVKEEMVTFFLNTSNLFEAGFTLSSQLLDSQCDSGSVESFIDPDPAGNVALVLVSCPNTKAVAVQLDLSVESFDWTPTDPLIECLDSLDTLIVDQSAVLSQAEGLIENMLRVDDDFDTSGTVAASGIAFQDGKFREIQVLSGYSNEFNTSSEMNTAMDTLLGIAGSIADDLPNLLYPANQTVQYRGRLTFTGDVTSVNAEMSEISIITLNGKFWNDFVTSVWRYTLEQMIEQDLRVSTLSATQVQVGGSIGGSVPANWLLGTGGQTLTGTVSFEKVQVMEDVNIADGKLINGVDLNDVLTPDSAETSISGVKKFRNVIVGDSVDVQLFVNDHDLDVWFAGLLSRKATDEQHLTGSVVLVNSVIVETDLTCKSIDDIDIVDFSKSVVLKNTEQTINGNIQFTSNTNFSALSVQLLNGISITDLLTKVTDQIVQSTISITSLQVNGNIQSELINNINVDDIVFFGPGETTINSGVSFLQDVIVNDVVSLDGSTINGFNLKSSMNPESFIIASDVQISGSLNVNDIEVSRINEVDIVDLKSRFWTKSTEQIVPISLTIGSRVLVQEDVNSLTLNSRLMTDYFKTKEPQTAGMDFEFRNLVIFDGSLALGSSIDGVDIDELANKVVRKSGVFDVKDIKTFKRLEVSGNIFVEDTFNDIRFPDDIALLNRPQTFSNIEFVSEVTVIGDVVVKQGDVNIVGTINDIKPRDFAGKVVLVGEDAILDGRLEFSAEASVDTLEVKGMLNDVNIRNLMDFGLRRYGRNVQTVVDLTVGGNLKLRDSLVVIRLNDYDPNRYLSKVVNKDNPGIISGVKRVPAVVVNADLNVDTFNDVVLDFSQLLSVSKEQTIKGNYDIKDMKLGNILVNKINGIDFSNFVLLDTDTPQNISGDITFEYILLQQNLRVLSETVNDCRILSPEPLVANIQDLSAFQSLTILEGQLILEQPSDNNEILANLLNNCLRVDRPGEVTADVKIEDPEGISSSFASVSVQSSRIGDVDLKKLFQESMRKSGDQIVTGPLLYNNGEGITLNDIQSISKLQLYLWNGVNIAQLLDNIVYKTGNHVIQAKKTIQGSWIIKGNLNLLGQISDLNLSDLVKVTDPTLPWDTTFSSLKISQKINTNGNIDNIDVNNLISNLIPLDGNTSISGNIKFQNDVIIGDLNVLVVNDVVVGELVLRTAAPQQQIAGMKIFTKDVDFDGNVFMKTLNGVDLGEIFDSVVVKDRDVDFTEEATFSGNLNIIDNSDIVFYNGINLTEAILSHFAVSTRMLDQLVSLQSTAEKAKSLLESLKSSRTSLDFEYFDIEESYYFNGTDPVQLQLRHSGSSHNSVLSIMKSLNGSQCGLNPDCVCHRTDLVRMTSGQPDDDATFRKILQDLSLENGMHYVLPDRNSGITFIVTFDKPCPEGSYDVSIIHLNAELAVTKVETLPAEGNIIDVKLESSTAGKIVLVMLKSNQVDVYLFNPDPEVLSFGIVEAVPVADAKAVAIAKHADDGIYLAIAAKDLSTLWVFNSEDRFELVREVNVEGPRDVAFSSTNDEIYVTFTQAGDKDIWTDYSLPPEVYRFEPAKQNFYIYQQLDIDRAISLTTFSPDGSSQFLVAANSSTINIYELIKGQGFVTEQSFGLNGNILDVESFGFNNDIYLTVALKKSKISVETLKARVRGLRKPT